jgi:hypothetical protein
MPDRQLDDLIVMALDTQAVITPERQAISWDRVQRRARVSVQRVGPDPRRAIWPMIENYLQVLRYVLLNEDIYHRAERNRHLGCKVLALTGDFTFLYYPVLPAMHPARS